MIEITVNVTLMKTCCEVHTCLSSGDVHNVHKCPQFQSEGDPGTGMKIRQTSTLHSALVNMTRKDLICCSTSHLQVFEIHG